MNRYIAFTLALIGVLTFSSLVDKAYCYDEKRVHRLISDPCMTTLP